MKRYQLLGLILSAGLLVTASSKAVILYGTDAPSINTTAPSGELAGSGWQYEGLFDGFLGTVVASNYFVTANHISGSVGDVFFLTKIRTRRRQYSEIRLAISRSGRLRDLSNSGTALQQSGR
jgi:hypothetical protein